MSVSFPSPAGLAGLRLPRFGFREAALPLAIVALIALLVVPIPPLLLDAFFIFNILVSLVVLMLAVSTQRPLDFSSFPTVLLFATLLRLALNVASTRIVLVAGHEGPGAAGHVIEAFGEFLIGGNFIVGLFVFAILVIINLVVITKGGGRVSEVSARFTLDALPGKQMAIDADLAAGLLTPDEAKARRQEVATEADFYGSMDGASKFVKGDAVAALLILFINIVGGLVIGATVHGLSLGEAASTYILLAIGDGLAAQVPSLLLSVAAAIIVTRVASPLDLGGQLRSQFGQASAWYPAAAILATIGLLPGMPHLLILAFAAAAAGAGWRLRPRAAEEPAAAVATPAVLPSSIEWSEIADHVPLSIEIGFGLVDLASEAKGAPLVQRITGVRRQLSQSLGFVVPPVRISDSLGLAAGGWRVRLGSIIAGEGEVVPGRLLAIEPGEDGPELPGIAATDPSFGLPARWIDLADKHRALAAGATVVDPATVLATFISQTIQANAHRLFGQDEAHALVRSLEANAPQLAQGLVPHHVSLSLLTVVLQRLLEERVPLRDFRRIAEVLSASGGIADAELLAERVRRALGGLIAQTVAAPSQPLPVVTYAAGLESLLTDAAALGSSFEPNLARQLTEGFSAAAAELAARGIRFALVTTPALRRKSWQLLRLQIPDLVVMAFDELPDALAVDVVAVIGGEIAGGRA